MPLTQSVAMERCAAAAWPRDASCAATHGTRAATIPCRAATAERETDGPEAPFPCHRHIGRHPPGFPGADRAAYAAGADNAAATDREPELGDDAGPTRHCSKTDRTGGAQRGAAGEDSGASAERVDQSARCAPG